MHARHIPTSKSLGQPPPRRRLCAALACTRFQVEGIHPRIARCITMRGAMHKALLRTSWDAIRSAPCAPLQNRPCDFRPTVPGETEEKEKAWRSEHRREKRRRIEAERAERAQRQGKTARAERHACLAQRVGGWGVCQAPHRGPYISRSALVRDLHKKADRATQSSAFQSRPFKHR